MKNRYLYKRPPFMGLLALGLIALGSGALFGCSNTTGDREKSAARLIRPVKTTVLAQNAAVETRSFPGIVAAARETELAFRVGGPLIKFDVNIGERVEKGAVIARIDPRDFNVGILRLSAALDEARAGLKAM